MHIIKDNKKSFFFLKRWEGLQVILAIETKLKHKTSLANIARKLSRVKGNLN